MPQPPVFDRVVARPRLRDLGVSIGRLPTGPRNSLTDVPGVRVGHVTLIRGEGKLTPGAGPVRTGVTVVVPSENISPYHKLPAAVDVINGYGKSVGLMQIQELGELESPIALTNTLNVGKVMDALVEWMIDRYPETMSVNAVVMECNDAFLNDIQGRHVERKHVFEALDKAGEEVIEGSVGAGTGMRGFGFKAGIGTASRVVRASGRAWTVGVLVVTNTGSPGDLRLDGMPAPAQRGESPAEEGSIIMIVATDAPAPALQLRRLARRAGFGLARAGGTAAHGSGDIALAFSLVPPLQSQLLPPRPLTQLFRAVIESVEEAVVNSVLACPTMVGADHHRAPGIDIGTLQVPAGIRHAPTNG